MKRHRWFWLLLAGAAVVFMVLLARAIWLPWIAQALIIEDAPRPAELIAVFAGAHGRRAERAARLYRDGLAPRVLVTGGTVSQELLVFCDRRVTGAELNAQVLLDSGVPQDAVTVIPYGTSTYEEGEAIKRFLADRGYRSLIAVSSPYHMRRVKATLERLLRGAGVDLQYSVEDDSGIDARHWWTREKDLVEVTTEYLKLGYYYLALF